MIQYEVLQGGPAELFSIDKQSGHLFYRNNNVDFKHASISPLGNMISVRAFDMGVPQLHSTTQVFVHFLVSSMRGGCVVS